MNVLLSIKPEFAFKIFDGTKKYEFRKSIFKKPGVKKVIVYASSPTGKFEDFKALGAILELSIGGCRGVDCKKALEVLPTMPWAAQIQKLDLSHTDVEGTAECSFVFGAPVRFFGRNFSSQNFARIFSSGSQNLQKIPG